MKLFSSVTATLLLLAASSATAQSVVEITPGPDAGEALQEALILAEAGSVILLAPGRYELTEGLSLDVDGVTVRGAGMDTTVLNFSGQEGGSEGLLITADRVVVERLAIEDTKGDGVKAKGVDQITLRDLRIEWTGGPDAENGAYGLYPVESRNVLIEGSTVIGASDAGIYVGQSENIIVRHNRAIQNVAGIEIENSAFADVYDNVATRNTGGILIFDLPNLPRQGGHSVRVFDNRVVDNDTENFAPPGNIVGMVAKGTGIMVMANSNVHVFDNELAGNGTVHVLIASYPNDYDDEDYNPYPRGGVLRDNRYGEGGGAPSGEVGALIAGRTGLPVPDIVWDGVLPFSDWLFGSAPENRIYIDEAEQTGFANLRMVSHTLFPWRVDVDREIAKYRGTLEAPEAVLLPQASPRRDAAMQR